jgi:subtilisin-like proprotein convertase family protein
VTARKEGWSVERVEVSVNEGENKGAVDFLLLPVRQAEACRAPAVPVPDGDAEGIHDELRLDAEGKLSAVAVQLDLRHTFVGDLVVELTSPAGTTVKLHERAGGSADDLVGWYPDEREPVTSLETFLGEEAGGRWTLIVRDVASVDTGILEGWCLRVLYAEPVSDPPDGPPRLLALGAVWPNPFNPSTHVDFDLPRPARVELAVFDLGGRRVATLASELLPAGRHQRTWEGRDGQGRPVASGLYVLRLRAEGRTLTRKALLLK